MLIDIHFIHVSNNYFDLRQLLVQFQLLIYDLSYILTVVHIRIKKKINITWGLMSTHVRMRNLDKLKMRMCDC
jgi:hypothetical protein